MIFSLIPKFKPHCIFSYLLLSFTGSIPAISVGETLTISEDRKYLESSCPHPGIQELMLYKEGVFKFTSFNLESRVTLLELAGKWQIDDDILSLNYINKSVQFHAESRVEELLDKKYLLVVLIPLTSDQRYPYTTCTYVDKRLVKELTGIE